MLNVTAFCAANAIAEKIRGGKPLKVEALNQTDIPMDSVVEGGVRAAIENGADASNAALITATLCYIAGSNVRAGVPSGNRKLGAMAGSKPVSKQGRSAHHPHSQIEQPHQRFSRRSQNI